MSELRRGMGLTSVVSTSTGLAFAAIEYLAAAGLLVYVAGSLAWLAIATAGVLVLLAWAFFGELNGLYPTAAAIRLYMSRSMDDRVALTITMSYMATIVLVLAADAYIVGSAFTHVTGLPGAVTGLVIALLLGAATVSNLAGINVAARVQDVATAVVILITVVLGVLAFGEPRTQGSRIAERLHPHGPGGFLTAVALGVLLFSAFEWVTTSSEEVRDLRLIPRGMLITLGILAVTCSLVATAMGRLLSDAELKSAYPQLFLGRHLLGEGGYVLMMAVTLVTAINTFNGGFITASRFVYAAAREGSLPPVFARLNDRLVPWVPVLVLAGASFVAALLVSLTGEFEVLLSAGAALESGIYAVAGYCVWSLRRRQPDAERPFRMFGAGVLSWVGMVLFGLLALVASTQVGDRTDPTPLLVIALVAGGSVYYVLRVLPKVQAAAAARASAVPRRRPVRAAATTVADPAGEAGDDEPPA
jgi:APA family basic amino acid/polyamine antiporter